MNSLFVVQLTRKYPTVAMDMENVQRSEGRFVNKLKQSEYSTIFHITLRGKECVMKVYRNREISQIESPLYEHRTFICESQAYRRLKEKGLCDKGLFPWFYGTINQLDPKHWKPHLDKFLGHKLLPSAVLIEYVPHMQMFDLSNFSTNRMLKLVHILEAIHAAKVLHADLYPRNMMVVPGTPDRVLWIDFDRSQTFSKPPRERQQGWFDEEIGCMNEFAEAMAKDHKEGKLRRAWHYYFEGVSPDYEEHLFGKGKSTESRVSNH